MNNENRLIMPEAEVAAALGPTGTMSPAPEPELSPYEYLLHALEAHIGAERDSLAHYRELAESTKDPVVELIMGIILEDEERHHALMSRIATRLKDDLNWSQSPGALPSRGAEATDTAAYESLRSFVASEREGIHELRKFAGRADGLYGGLPSELLEMMARDSEKHEHLLRFLFLRIGSTISRTA